jgi:hypothetical protein
MLQRFTDDVWTESRPAKFWGVECGSRMAVVRLDGGGLFVLSPVHPDPELRREIDALGEVRAVVSPSLFHHLHVAAWMAAYPRAIFAACPGLEWKRPDLAFSCVLGDQPHEAWARDLQQIYFSARRENEVVFHHPRSKTFLCVDALLNLSTHEALTTRVLARVVGNTAPGVGHLERVMIRDRRLARRQVDRILEWDFDKATLAHGRMVDRDGREVVRRAYAWL